jgi:hypothetical protein
MPDQRQSRRRRPSGTPTGAAPAVPQPDGGLLAVAKALGHHLPTIMSIATLLTTAWIATQNIATQRELNTVKSTQDQQLAVLNRELVSPRLVVEKALPTNVPLPAGLDLSQGLPPGSPLVATAIAYEQAANRLTVSVTNDGHAEALGVCLEASTPRGVEATKVDPTHATVVPERLSDQVVQVCLEKLPVDATLGLTLTLRPASEAELRARLDQTAAALQARGINQPALAKPVWDQALYDPTLVDLLRAKATCDNCIATSIVKEPSPAQRVEDIRGRIR